MNTYRWTKRIGLAGIAFLAAIAVFVTIVSILNIRVAGIYPEAFRLTAMMTAPSPSAWWPSPPWQRRWWRR